MERQWTAFSRGVVANPNDCSLQTEGQGLSRMNSLE